jgi:hypothetical protein
MLFGLIKKTGVQRMNEKFYNIYQHHHHHHQPINVPTAGALAFLMDYT